VFSELTPTATLSTYLMTRCGAFRSGSKEVVDALLSAGPAGRHPSIKDVNKRGLTPTGEAVAAGCADVAELLIGKVCGCAWGFLGLGIFGRHLI
jgi:hypothetical protein